MKRSGKVVVRVVMNEEQMISWSLLLEQLRYAGVIVSHKNTASGHPECFDILPPAGVKSDIWASANAERMRSFGINAVDAPVWG